MPLTLDWNDAFSVAHPALDAEHREMIFVIRRIAQAAHDRPDLRPLLCELKQKTAAHFDHEGRILRGIAAATSSARQSRKFLAAMAQALVDEHLAEHDAALAWLEAMIRRTLADNSAKPSEVGETLAHWFVGHAIKHDAHLKTLFQSIAHDCPELLDRVA